MTDSPPSAQMISSQRTVTSVKKTLDEFGNVISEDIQSTTLPADEVTTTDLTSNVQLLSTERKLISVRKVLDQYGNVVSEETRTLDGNEDFDDFTVMDVPANAQVISTKRKVTSVKKIVDEFGNVISEDVQTTTLPSEETSSSFTSVPNISGAAETMQSYSSQEETGNSQDLFSNVSHVSSTRTVTSVKKTVDEFGNVISEDIQTSRVEGGDVVGEEEQILCV